MLLLLVQVHVQNVAKLLIVELCWPKGLPSTGDDDDDVPRYDAHTSDTAVTGHVAL